MKLIFENWQKFLTQEAAYERDPEMQAAMDALSNHPKGEQLTELARQRAINEYRWDNLSDEDRVLVERLYKLNKATFGAKLGAQQSAMVPPEEDVPDFHELEE